MSVLIDKCITCKSYDNEKNRVRNKLRCMIECEEYARESSQRAIAYNRAVCGEEFDTNEIYEHSNIVFGSGCKEGGE